MDEAPDELSGKAVMRAYGALEARAGALLGAINAATAELVETLAALMAGGFVAGYRNPEHYVVLRWGVSPARARTLVRLASRHAELPDTFGRLQRGEITEDQAGVVARFVTPYRERDVPWTQYATVPQLRVALFKLPLDERRDHGLEPAAEPADSTGGDTTGEDPTDEKQSPTPSAPRDVSFGYDDDGSWWSRIRLPGDEGAFVEAGLRAARDEQFDQGRGTASWADAFLRLVGVGLDGLEGPTTAGRLPSERHQVLVHVDADRPDESSCLHLGPLLSRSMRRYLSCDCTLTWVLERHGQPVGKGRRTRVVDPLLRALIEDRDQTCVVPGCTQRRWLHCHHLVHWEDEGPTDPTT